MANPYSAPPRGGGEPGPLDLGAEWGKAWALGPALAELSARALARKLPHRRVSDLVFRIMPSPCGSVCGKPRLEVGDPVTGQRRDHEGRRERRTRVGGLGERKQHGFFHQVDL